MGERLRERTARRNRRSRDWLRMRTKDNLFFFDFNGLELTQHLPLALHGIKKKRNGSAGILRQLRGNLKPPETASRASGCDSCVLVNFHIAA